MSHLLKLQFHHYSYLRCSHVRGSARGFWNRDLFGLYPCVVLKENWDGLQQTSVALNSNKVVQMMMDGSDLVSMSVLVELMLTGENSGEYPWKRNAEFAIKSGKHASSVVQDPDLDSSLGMMSSRQEVHAFLFSLQLQEVGLFTIITGIKVIFLCCLVKLPDSCSDMLGWAWTLFLSHTPANSWDETIIPSLNGLDFGMRNFLRWKS